MTVFLLLSFVFGTCVGSFVQCVTERCLKGESVTGRSRCDACHTKLKCYDLCPVVSWLVLHGKCRYCGADIPKSAVFVEVLMGVLYAYAGDSYGLSAFTVLFWCVSAVIVSLSIEDIHQLTIHDVYHVLLVMIRVIYAIVVKESGFVLFIIEAAIVTCFMFCLARAMQCLLHKVCLGMGDVKLLGDIALFVGLQGTMSVCALASFVALIVACTLRKAKLPFGPFLGGALLVVLTACGGMVYCIH